MNKKLALIASIFLCLTLIGAWFYYKNIAPNNKDIIYIAGNIPLTGPIASFSGQYHKGFNMGIIDSCNSQNISPDIFKIDFQDNAGKPSTAVTVMQKQFILSQPKIYISGTSGMSDAIISEVLKKGIPHFLVSFDAFMTQNNPLTLRILPNFKIEAPLFIKFIKVNEAKKVFFFTPNLKAYLEQSDYLMLPELKKANIEYQRELFGFEQKDYLSLVAKAKKYEPDVIVISGYAFHVYPIIKALREYNIVPTIPVISTLDYIDLLHGNIPKEELKNIAFVSPECEIPEKIHTFNEWGKAFKLKYGSEPSYVDAYAYDTARIIVTSYKKEGKIDIDTIKKIMPFKGIVGKIELDEERDLKSTLVIGYLNEKGIIEEWK
jgi:ABC-type branched-subunit amino acid transport system substrate-binding protein